MSAHGAEPGRTDIDRAEGDVVGADVATVDLARAVWKKSSYSGGNGSCVEVADLGEHIAVRDSKDREGPKLVFEREVWGAFLNDLKAGAYSS